MPSIKDYLFDIVSHTHTLGKINLLKITGTEEETKLSSIDIEKKVIISAKFKEPLKEFADTFGMPNLQKLSIILTIPEYDENEKINVTYKDDVPVGIHFENGNADFKNDYRFTTKTMIMEQLPDVTFQGATWNVEFSPTQVDLDRLKYQYQAHADEELCVPKTENGNLKIYFGDDSSHSGNFVFAKGVDNLAQEWSFPIQDLSAIMNLNGDVTVRISDQGVIMITVDSGLIEYDYFLPASRN
tara:strand:- start:1628 stop:2353 length:726 start_codon:yes stop_codon:yes gene_type:complete